MRMVSDFKKTPFHSIFGRYIFMLWKYKSFSHKRRLNTSGRVMLCLSGKTNHCAFEKWSVFHGTNCFTNHFCCCNSLLVWCKTTSHHPSNRTTRKKLWGNLQPAHCKHCRALFMLPFANRDEWLLICTSDIIRSISFVNICHTYTNMYEYMPWRAPIANNSN